MIKEVLQRGREARDEQRRRQQVELQRRNELWNASVRNVFFSNAWSLFWPIWFTICFFVGAHFWLMAEVQTLRAQMQAASNSPQAVNAQLDAIETQTKQLCIAKGYSSKKCDEILGQNAPQ
jgi:hypothetical protein